MLDRITGAPEQAQPGKVLKMVHNPRMGGSVPAWVKADGPLDNIARNLASAGTTAPAQQTGFKAALSYQMDNPRPNSTNEEFGFFDLLDMVNPLQHIPLVNIAYRKLTGDEIKAAPQIIGGAIFGGPVGAAGGLANVIIQEETGRDIAGNAMALASGEKISYRKNLSNDPEKRLGDALAGNPPLEDLPVSLLAFTDNGMRSGFKTERNFDNQVAEQKPDGTIVIAAADFSPYEIY